MRMPAARIMSSVEIRSALARGSAATSGTSQACAERDRAAADQIEPVERRAPAVARRRLSSSAMSGGGVASS